jgi:hypothetical protein
MIEIFLSSFLGSLSSYAFIHIAYRINDWIFFQQFKKEFYGKKDN